MKLTDAQLDRAKGALVGAAFGDALGAGYEFEVIDDDELWPGMIGGGLGPFEPGEWTDDTSLTWCVAEVAASGIKLESEEALTRIARNFRDWYETSPPDIGGTTASALRGGGKNPTGLSQTKAARYSEGVTNGSLMRTAPVALAYLDDPVALTRAAMKVSALTHSSTLAQEACALWALTIRHAVLTGEFDIRSQIAYLPDAAEMVWNVFLDHAEERSPYSFTNNGRAVVALQAAWSSIYHTEVPPELELYHTYLSLTTAIRIGVDTDTVASIAGALLGAKWGLSSMSAEWRGMLHGYPGKTGADLERLALLTVGVNPDKV